MENSVNITYQELVEITEKVFNEMKMDYPAAYWIMPNGNIVDARECPTVTEETLKNILGKDLKSMTRYRCEYCGREFRQPNVPHTCRGNYRKRHYKFKEISYEGDSN